MSVSIPVGPFFDHSRHRLTVYNCAAPIDVLAFEGEERLSQCFKYRIEFTSAAPDIPAEDILGHEAYFSLYPLPQKPLYRGMQMPAPVPLRKLHGVITDFKRLSSSRDEARYEIVLQPRLALLGRGREYRLYQQQSVPEIVESILRSRHGYLGQHFLFDLLYEYPRRLQVMQYGESDLAFIERLLAEVGIWYRFGTDERLNIGVLEFHDEQRFYQFDVELPCRSGSGLSSGDQDAVWHLQSHHQVVEKHIHFRSYDPNDVFANLEGDVDQTRGATTTYGDAHHVGDAFTAMGDRYAFRHEQEPESGIGLARLHHERYLNDRTRLSGTTSSPILAPGQCLTLKGDAPAAFAPGAVIVGLTTRAARDSSFIANFTGIPYDRDVCFRPALKPKPIMAGTVAARVSSSQQYNPYADTDEQGRYHVRFLFDRDTWPQGQESMWLRLARPYAGDTHGLHLPLIIGTEVAIAFENGDPDKPYIAHALHDSDHPDHINYKNEKRNILRTPANNKLRMEDTRGEEHVKLASEHGGKSQLNLGHVVDSTKKKRGAGFELRTDAHGALRAGQGVFISADAQPLADGPVLDMKAAVNRLKEAGEQTYKLSREAEAAGADPAEVHHQMALLREEVEQLRGAVALLSAPNGIAVTSGKHLQLAAQQNLILNAGGQADVSVVKRLFLGIGAGLSAFVDKLGIKLIANQGPVSVQAQNDKLELLARHGLDITSSEDEIRITARKRITLNANGSYIQMDRSSIEAGTEGDFNIRSVYFGYQNEKCRSAPVLPDLPPPNNPPFEYSQQFQLLRPDGQIPMANSRYVIKTHDGAQEWRGISDEEGLTERVWTVDETDLSISYDLPEEEEEEEEERPEGITLRIGLFFDGTGNNLSNAAATQQCQREDAELFDREALKLLIEQCKELGYEEYSEGRFKVAPDSSFGNSVSNVVHLHKLYPDDTAQPIPSDSNVAYLKVYVEGIGTRGGEKDDIYGQGFGQGKTGVVARVNSAPSAVEEQMLTFNIANPMRVIRKIEFDIFGFSRGAAAARHCANELIKSRRGVFAKILQGGYYGVCPDFDFAKDVDLNFIGLFDTVAAIADPFRANINITDAHNPGVNLYLPPGCARKVLQLTARDEIRLNFALNSVKGDHQEIVLPGVHSDVGGGYLPIGQERMFLTPLVRVSLKHDEALENSSEWRQIHEEAEALRATGLAGDGEISIRKWETLQSPRGRFVGGREHWMSITLDRSVRGELSLVALRVMRELAVIHGVPFDVLDSEGETLRLPEELQNIAEKAIESACSGVQSSLIPIKSDCCCLGIFIVQQTGICVKGWQLISRRQITKEMYIRTGLKEDIHNEGSGFGRCGGVFFDCVRKWGVQSTSTKVTLSYMVCGSCCT
ncbi:type VI secretion system tip protein VgrG [Pseudomonas putida]